MSNASFLRVPKYRRHKSSGQAVVTLGGRDCYLGKYNTAASKQAYQRLTAEWLLTEVISPHSKPTSPWWK